MNGGAIRERPQCNELKRTRDGECVKPRRGQYTPGLTFGKHTDRIPPDGTKRSHAANIERLTACVPAVPSGIGPEASARRIEKPTADGYQLLRLH